LIDGPGLGIDPEGYLPESLRMLRIQGIGGDAAADTGSVDFGFLAVFEIPTRDSLNQR
jgi:hypothetical protein